MIIYRHFGCGDCDLAAHRLPFDAKVLSSIAVTANYLALCQVSSITISWISVLSAWVAQVGIFF